MCLGNEVPADVVRWAGTQSRGRSPSWQTRPRGRPRRSSPTPTTPTEYLPLDALDFLTFNVFLEDRDDFRRYLTQLQHLAGDRPLVLGEIGLARHR